VKPLPLYLLFIRRPEPSAEFMRRKGPSAYLLLFYHLPMKPRALEEETRKINTPYF